MGGHIGNNRQWRIDGNLSGINTFHGPALRQGESVEVVPVEVLDNQIERDGWAIYQLKLEINALRRRLGEFEIADAEPGFKVGQKVVMRKNPQARGVVVKVTKSSVWVIDPAYPDNEVDFDPGDLVIDDE